LVGATPAGGFPKVLRLRSGKFKIGECYTTTFSDIVDAVTTFAANYDIYVVAGLILGAGAWLMRKLIKAGR
jgi:hypothetical protein